MADAPVALGQAAAGALQNAAFGELDRLGAAFAEDLVTQLEASQSRGDEAHIEVRELWRATASTLRAYWRIGDEDLFPVEEAPGVWIMPPVVGAPHGNRRDTVEAACKVAHLAASDRFWNCVLPRLHVAYRQEDDFWVDRVHGIAQLLYTLYGLVDPTECTDCDALGPWQHAAALGVPHSTAKAAALGLQSHAHQASVALSAVIRAAVSQRVGRRRGSAGAAGAIPPLGEDDSQFANVEEAALRCIRHMASLDVSLFEPLDSEAVLDAIAANLAVEPSPSMALSTLWAFSDSNPAACNLLAEKYPHVVATLRTHITRVAVPQAVPQAVQESAPPGEDEAVEVAEAAIGTLWGCSSRVSPRCVLSFMDSGIVGAAADVVACRLATYKVPSPSARACAAGALAGWLAALTAAASTQQTLGGDIAEAVTRMGAVWSDPGLVDGVTEFLTDALAVLDADLDDLDTRAAQSSAAEAAAAAASAAITSTMPPLDAVTPAEARRDTMSRWGRSMWSVEVPSLSMHEVVLTAMYDWKARDLSEAAWLVCRLVARAVSVAGTSDEAHNSRHMLPAAVAAFPICVMLHPSAELLTRRRVAHLCSHGGMLVKALSALSSSACPVATAVGSATLVRLLRAWPAGVPRLLRTQRAVQLQHTAALGNQSATVPPTVQLQLQPSGAIIRASGPLLAAHSGFFSALFASEAQGFAPIAASDGGEKVIQLHDVDPSAFSTLLHFCSTGGAAFKSIADALTMNALVSRFLMPAELDHAVWATVTDRLTHLRGGLLPALAAGETRRHVQPPPEWMPVPLPSLCEVVQDCVGVLVYLHSTHHRDDTMIYASEALDALAHSIAVRGDRAVAYIKEHVLECESEVTLPPAASAAIQALLDEYQAAQAAKLSSLHDVQSPEPGEDASQPAAESGRRLRSRKRKHA